jgi:uncharacterized protein (DUF305 family)
MKSPSFPPSSSARRCVLAQSMLLGVALIGMSTAVLAASPVTTPFQNESRAAMDKMMAAMEIKQSGGVDNDFVAMMVPHHQGAVDMAKAELDYGHNVQLRRLAREIVATQQQEITVMRNAVTDGQPFATQSIAHDGMKMSR